MGRLVIEAVAIFYLALPFFLWSVYAWSVKLLSQGPLGSFEVVLASPLWPLWLVRSVAPQALYTGTSVDVGAFLRLVVGCAVIDAVLLRIVFELVIRYRRAHRHQRGASCGVVE